MQTFFSDADYQHYLNLICKYKDEAGVQIWAYCLMPNHVHLVAIPAREDSLAALFRQVHRRYTRTINLREGWKGHLWQERFHSFVMDEQHLVAAVRYVELNPVNAGLVRQAAQWPWSSVRAHLLGEDDKVTAVQPMLERINNWQGYLTGDDDSDLIDVIRQHSRSGRPAGTDQFMSQLEKMTGLALRPKKRGRKPLL
ncbi:putative transposase [Simiduia aestuariiviva]|uniref:Putative transposase n=2 Tax=Simiduia aestuariiviva TaxID=1510459 RepID=A0A839UIQ8_9GAMM|nr:putative transposase [Simiduia aestuariiviva]